MTDDVVALRALADRVQTGVRTVLHAIALPEFVRTGEQPARAVVSAVA